MNTLNRMSKSWNEKAVINAYHWVDSTKDVWSKDEYYDKGALVTRDKFIEPLMSKGYSLKDFEKKIAVDIGCGTGRLTVALSKYFKHVYGVDVAEEMIQIAKEDHQHVNSKVEFLLSNGNDLSMFDDNSIDNVFSYIVFQHIPDRNTVINYIHEIARVLKRGGTARFQVRGFPGKLSEKTPNWAYKGFNKFYIALEKRGSIFIPKIRNYDTVYGAFFNKDEISAVISKLGIQEYSIESEIDKRFLWVTFTK